MNVPLNRNGGNNTSRYNWQLNADNRGDTFIANAKAAGAQAMLTIPIIDWVAKVATNRSKLASYSISKYGPQTGNDRQGFPDAGNGFRASDNAEITWNDPADANVPNSSLF